MENKVNKDSNFLEVSLSKYEAAVVYLSLVKYKEIAKDEYSDQGCKNESEFDNTINFFAAITKLIDFIEEKMMKAERETEHGTK